MTPKERELIKRVADRLQKGRDIKKDGQADQFINKIIARKRNASYLLTQTVILQDVALHRAKQRIAELEHQLKAGTAKQKSGGFFSGLFGGSETQKPAPIQPPVRHAGRDKSGQGKNSGQFSEFLWTAASVATGITAGNYLVNTINDYLDGTGDSAASFLGEDSGTPGQETFADVSPEADFSSEQENYAEEAQLLESEESYATDEAYLQEEPQVAETSDNTGCEIDTDEGGGFIDEIGENLWS